MDNQHRQIRGYRELNRREIEVMNSIKAHASAIGELVEHLKNEPEADKRWIAEGATDLQKGFMSLTRAVAKPEFF